MEATFLSKLKVLLAKYNSVMCHIDVIFITQQERRSNLECQQKSRCKFACEAGSTVPWPRQVLNNCMLHLHAQVWESNSLHNLQIKRKPLEPQPCHWITHIFFHFRDGSLGLYSLQSPNSPLHFKKPSLVAMALFLSRQCLEPLALHALQDSRIQTALQALAALVLMTSSSFDAWSLRNLALLGLWFLLCCKPLCCCLPLPSRHQTLNQLFLLTPCKGLSKG